MTELCANATKDNCDICKGAGCNSVSYGVTCHQCTPLNPMCAYQQMDTLVLPCDAGKVTSLFDYNDCYTGRT